MAVYTDYIAHEIKQNLNECAKSAKLTTTHFARPLEPIVEKIGKVNYGESNYAIGPLTKTIYLSDAFGTRYKVSVEDLKHVKGHGWITHEEADELDVHYDRDLGYYVVSTPEYNTWLTEAREKNFPSSQQRLF